MMVASIRLLSSFSTFAACFGQTFQLTCSTCGQTVIGGRIQGHRLRMEAISRALPSRQAQVDLLMQ
jgi:hypothetical protein